MIIFLHATRITIDLVHLYSSRSHVSMSWFVFLVSLGDLLTEYLCYVGEQVMETLVDIVLFLNQEINYTFGNPGISQSEIVFLEISGYISLYKIF